MDKAWEWAVAAYGVVKSWYGAGALLIQHYPNTALAVMLGIAVLGWFY